VGELAATPQPWLSRNSAEAKPHDADAREKKQGEADRKHAHAVPTCGEIQCVQALTHGRTEIMREVAHSSPPATGKISERRCESCGEEPVTDRGRTDENAPGVSKRIDTPYRSWPFLGWRKIKCAG
jgi:hypothetical protein